MRRWWVRLLDRWDPVDARTLRHHMVEREALARACHPAGVDR